MGERDPRPTGRTGANATEADCATAGAGFATAAAERATTRPRPAATGTGFAAAGAEFEAVPGIAGTAASPVGAALLDAPHAGAPHASADQVGDEEPGARADQVGDAEPDTGAVRGGDAEPDAGRPAATGGGWGAGFLGSALRGAVGAATGLVEDAVEAVRGAAETGAGLVGGLTGVARAVATPGGARGAVVEAAWLTARTALYPWGAFERQFRPEGHLAQYRTDRLPPRRRGLVVSSMEAAGTPIVLVHGIGDNRSAFAVLSGALRRRGFGVVHAVNYSVLTALTGDVRRAAALLGEQVERICEQTGSDRVHVVGHSLGGLIARYYVQRLSGDARVKTLVTLGTPHGGTLAAYLFPTSLTRQLRPGSDLLSELAEPCRPCRTRFVVVWSDMDQVVIPQRHGRLEHPSLDVQEYRIRDSGHLSLSVDARTLHVVVTAVTRTDEPLSHPIVPVRAGFSSSDVT